MIYWPSVFFSISQAFRILSLGFILRNVLCVINSVVLDDQLLQLKLDLWLVLAGGTLGHDLYLFLFIEARCLSNNLLLKFGLLSNDHK